MGSAALYDSKHQQTIYEETIFYFKNYKDPESPANFIHSQLASFFLRSFQPFIEIYQTNRYVKNNGDILISSTFLFHKNVKVN